MPHLSLGRIVRWLGASAPRNAAPGPRPAREPEPAAAAALYVPAAGGRP
jgi:hypothetical protein